MSTLKTIAFLGASGGCGLSALKHALADGHTCIGLCRTPSKLTDQFPSAQYPNLTIIQGNAHDAAAVSKCLVRPSDRGQMVDHIVFSIGGVFNLIHRTLDDPHVCERGIETLLQALAELRACGVPGGSRPSIIAVSTTGISKAGRDVPLLLHAFYRAALTVAHDDKAAMEERLVASGEAFVAVRPSLLVDGEQVDRVIRVGVEDLRNGRNVVERSESGYAISRSDVGRWIYQHLLRSVDGKESGVQQYLGKAVSLTW